MEKSIHKLKAEYVFKSVWEREKINSFDITTIIFKTLKVQNF